MGYRQRLQAELGSLRNAPNFDGVREAILGPEGSAVSEFPVVRLGRSALNLAAVAAKAQCGFVSPPEPIQAIARPSNLIADFERVLSRELRFALPEQSSSAVEGKARYIADLVSHLSPVAVQEVCGQQPSLDYPVASRY